MQEHHIIQERLPLVPASQCITSHDGIFIACRDMFDCLEATLKQELPPVSYYSHLHRPAAPLNERL